MKTKSLAELMESVNTPYLSEQERIEAIARAQAAEYAVELVISAMQWVKRKLISVCSLLNPIKHSHA